MPTLGFFLPGRVWHHPILVLSSARPAWMSGWVIHYSGLFLMFSYSDFIILPAHFRCMPHLPWPQAHTGSVLQVLGESFCLFGCCCLFSFAQYSEQWYQQHNCKIDLLLLAISVSEIKGVLTVTTITASSQKNARGFQELVTTMHVCVCTIPTTAATVTHSSVLILLLQKCYNAPFIAVS